MAQMILNNEVLIHFVKKKLEERFSNTGISPPDVPTTPICNEAELFRRVRLLNQKISQSLLSRVRSQTGKFGFSLNSGSAFRYDYSHRLIDEAVKAHYYDPLAQVFEPRYRSHYCHSFLVGALGWWMLECVHLDGSPLKEKYLSFTEKHYSGKGFDLWDIWWSIALLHDIGYPFYLFWKRLPLLLALNGHYPILDNSYCNPFEQIIDNLFQCFSSPTTEKLKELYNEFNDRQASVLSANQQGTLETLRKEFVNKANTFFDTLHHPFTFPIRDESRGKNGELPSLRQILKEFYDQFPKESVKPFDHGIASAVFSNAYLDKPYTLNDDKVAQLIYTPIAFHNLKEIDANYDTCDDFDVFFLKLIDQLQEWGRGILIEKSNEILMESSGIRLGPISGDTGDTIDLREGLEAVYMFYDENAVFSKSGWDFGIIRNDKKKAFSKLCIDGNTPLNVNIKLEIVSEFDSRIGQ